MISLLLLKKIAELFVCIFMGYVLVRSGKAKPEDSRVLSVVSLYLLNPCVVISSYQIQCTPELLSSLQLSLGAALLIHLLLFLMVKLLKRPLRLDPVEQASSMYSNCANLLIPVITAILGKEWVVFASMYFVVQIAMYWTHCRMLISGERTISLKNIFWNPNVIACFVGIALFLTGVTLPEMVGSAIDTVGSMLGPVGMMIVGMLMAGADLKKILRTPGVWKVSFLRLIAFPLVVLVILKYSGMAALAPNGTSILLISLLGACAPSGATVTQLAQVYGGDGEYASAINVFSTLLCIVTMPIIVALYSL